MSRFDSKSYLSTNGSSREAKEFLTGRILDNKDKRSGVYQQEATLNRPLRLSEEKLWSALQYAIDNNLLSKEEYKEVRNALSQAEVQLSETRLALFAAETAPLLSKSSKGTARKRLQRLPSETQTSRFRGIPSVSTVSTSSRFPKRLLDYPTYSFVSQRSRPTQNLFKYFSERVTEEEPEQPEQPEEEQEEPTDVEETVEADTDVDVSSSAAAPSLEQLLQIVEERPELLLEGASSIIPLQRQLLESVIGATQYASDFRDRTEAVPKRFATSTMADAWVKELKVYYKFVDRVASDPILVFDEDTSRATVDILVALRSLTNVLYDAAKNLGVQRNLSDEEILQSYNLPEFEQRTVAELLELTGRALLRYSNLDKRDLLGEQMIPPQAPSAEVATPKSEQERSLQNETILARLKRALSGSFDLLSLVSLLIGLWSYVGADSILVRPIVLVLKYIVSVAIQRYVDVSSLAPVTRFLTDLNLATQVAGRIGNVAPEKVRRDLISALGASNISNLVVGYIPASFRKMIEDTVRFLQLRDYKKNATNKFIDTFLDTLEVAPA